jgi:hypothetical protein
MIDPRYWPAGHVEVRLLALMRQRGISLRVIRGRLVHIVGPGVDIRCEGLRSVSEGDLSPVMTDRDVARRC